MKLIYINLITVKSMHIKNYLQQFSSISSNQKRKVQNIFVNLNRSRKSLSKLYEHQNQKINPQRYQKAQKFIQSKNAQFAFDDNLFTALYKTNLKSINKQDKTINSNKPRISKLSFKLNYVQDYRPLIKQKIFKKVNQQYKYDNFITQVRNTQKKSSKNIFKKIKIEEQIFQKSHRNRRQIKFRNLSVKVKGKTIDQSPIYNYTERKDKMQNHKNQTISGIHKTLPIRKIKTSLEHYRKHKLSGNQSTPHVRQSKLQNTRVNLEEKIPDYAKNIMKPCKIVGIQLSTRPHTGNQKDLSSQFSLSVKKRKKVNDQQSQWKLRVVKTQRQSRPKKSLQNIKQNLQKIINHQKKKYDFQPWANQNMNEVEQTDDILLRH